ncbi:MAG: type II toxin-antitoxin system RelE/ParE family toxin [Bacteroidales bacterium]|nr:type II toxin-antitoxin system RelE/ParE family toxin [Bacteroidales bacterium]MBR4498296.1 type II toxin-antitoxin system RelE/ParE family toxin [Bacteroidales bacterium]MBR7034396.1 type II toxin-antitoxin system RelE/ParE family toxin [Bacteroidales bacterium]
MKYNFFVTTDFEKTLKRLCKKYRSLVDDLETFKQEFEEKYPDIGVDLGGGYRKIRMEIKSKNKGKSGGARIITYDLCLKVEESDILLVAMFDKNEFENIRDDYYKSLAEEYLKNHQVD